MEAQDYFVLSAIVAHIVTVCQSLILYHTYIEDVQAFGRRYAKSEHLSWETFFWLGTGHALGWALGGIISGYIALVVTAYHGLLRWVVA